MTYTKTKEEVKGFITLQTAILVRQMWSNKFTVLDHSPVKDLLAILRPMFTGNQQQDAQELFNFLLEKLHQDLHTSYFSAEVGVPDPSAPLEAQAANYLLTSKAENHSMIWDLFYFTGVTSKICMWGECLQVCKKGSNYWLIS